MSYRGIEGDCLYVLQGFLDAKNRSEKLLIKAIAVKLISFRSVQITFVYLIGYRLKEEVVLVRPRAKITIVLKNLAFVTRLTVMQCKRSFNKIEFENNGQCVVTEAIITGNFLLAWL